MVLIFSKVQRLNLAGAPNGFYGYLERVEVSEELAKTLIAAGVAGKVETEEPAKAEPEKTIPEPVREPEPVIVQEETAGSYYQEPVKESEPVNKRGPKRRNG